MSSQQLANDQYDGFKNQVGMHKVQLQLWVAVSMVIIFNALYMYMCYVGTTLYAPTRCQPNALGSSYFEPICFYIGLLSLAFRWPVSQVDTVQIGLPFLSIKISGYSRIVCVRVS